MLSLPLKFLSMVLSLVESIEDVYHGPFGFKPKQKIQGYFISSGHVLLQLCEPYWHLTWLVTPVILC